MIYALKASSAWDQRRTNQSERCQVCRAVYPGELRKSVEGGVCQLCKNAKSEGQS
jgi:hypothetical protein